jgi:hypothetical protein
MYHARMTPWDAAVLGTDTNEVSFDAPEDVAAYEALVGSRVGFTSVRLDAAQRDIREAVEDHGYRQVGTYLRARGDLRRVADATATCHLRPAVMDDAPRVRELIATWGGFGPFFDDYRIPRAAAVQRMQNRIGSLMERPMLVAEDAEGMAGFFAYRPEPAHTELVLAGVRAGSGLHGTAFWAQCFAVMCASGATYGEGTLSASNLGAVNVYARLGFRFVQTLLQYHRYR